MKRGSTAAATILARNEENKDSDYHETSEVCLENVNIIYFLICVPKITYLCSKLCNNETHTSKYW